MSSESELNELKVLIAQILEDLISMEAGLESALEVATSFVGETTTSDFAKRRVRRTNQLLLSTKQFRTAFQQVIETLEAMQEHETLDSVRMKEIASMAYFVRMLWDDVPKYSSTNFSDEETYYEGFGYHPDAFMDTMNLINSDQHTGKPRSSPCVNYYMSIYQALMIVKSQSSGAKAMGQTFIDAANGQIDNANFAVRMNSFLRFMQRGSEREPTPFEIESLVSYAFDWMGSAMRKMQLIYLVALFEGFLLDTIDECIQMKPDMLSSQQKVVDYETVLKLPTKEAILNYLRQAEVAKLSDYPDMVTFFRKRLKIDIYSSIEEERSVADIRSRRHLIVHNRGLVDAKYQRETTSTLEIDTPIPVSIDYLEEATYTLTRIVSRVSASVVEKGLNAIYRPGKGELRSQQINFR